MLVLSSLKWWTTHLLITTVFFGIFHKANAWDTTRFNVWARQAYRCLKSSGSFVAHLMSDPLSVVMAQIFSLICSLFSSYRMYFRRVLAKCAPWIRRKPRTRETSSNCGLSMCPVRQIKDIPLVLVQTSDVKAMWETAASESRISVRCWIYNDFNERRTVHRWGALKPGSSRLNRRVIPGLFRSSNARPSVTMHSTEAFCNWRRRSGSIERFAGWYSFVWDLYLTFCISCRWLPRCWRSNRLNEKRQISRYCLRYTCLHSSLLIVQHASICETRVFAFELVIVMDQMLNLFDEGEKTSFRQRSRSLVWRGGKGRMSLCWWNSRRELIIHQWSIDGD